MDNFFPGMLAGIFLTFLLTLFIPSHSVTRTELDWAQQQCAANGGIAAIRPEDMGHNAKARCNNGAEFYKRQHP